MCAKFASGEHSAFGRRVPAQRERVLFDNLLVRIHFIIVMIRWTGLAPRELEFPFPGSLASTFRQARGRREPELRQPDSLLLSSLELSDAQVYEP